MLQIRINSSSVSLWLVGPQYSISESGDQVVEGELENAAATILVNSDSVLLNASQPIEINGTLIQEHALAHGDVIVLGSSQLRITDPKLSVLESQQQTTQSTPVIQWYLVSTDAGQEVERIPLESELTIGRSVECDIVLNDHRLSRQHAQISVKPNGVEVKDLNSSNGTFVNDSRIVKKILSEGDRVCFDRMCFQLTRSNALEEDIEKTNLRPSIEQWQRLNEAKPKSKPPAQKRVSSVNAIEAQSTPSQSPPDQNVGNNKAFILLFLISLVALFMLGFYLVR